LLLIPVRDLKPLEQNVYKTSKKKKMNLKKAPWPDQNHYFFYFLLKKEGSMETKIENFLEKKYYLDLKLKMLI